MNRKFALAAFMFTMAVVGAGCATQPSHFYMLSSVATRPAAVAGEGQGPAVVVGPVSVPAVVDVPQIVLSSGSNEVTIDEYNRWASPLQNNIADVVAENLVTMLGTPRVSMFQRSLNADADYRVAIEVQRFESVPGEVATLNAIWIVRRLRDGKAMTGRTTVRQPVQDSGYGALVAAHSRALARMSEEIAEAIRKQDRVSQ
ncbi:MAG TPA: PqiC family protein [Casimicrobiaceae bacterium]|nr:PqiC family protein [Casimicrobiaceae bacterium]